MLGTEIDALLFIGVVWAVALWAIALGEYMLLHGVTDPPVWLMLFYWIVPVIIGGVVFAWARRRRKAVHAEAT